jgi:class 3 adenylate cyclase
VTHVGHGDARLGAIVHDAALDDDRDLLDGVSAAFAMAVDRERLATSVRAQADDAMQLPSGPVTFLYADVEGSTRLLARIGERYADVLSEERRIIRATVRDSGGAEIDSRADEFFAVFPQGTDPIGAALEIHRRLRDRAWPDGAEVKVRIGLHGGEPQRTAEGYVGLDVHRASRVGSAGHGAQTLLSQAARDRLQASLPPGAALRCLGVFQLKGLAEPDPIWQLDVADLPGEFAPLRV